MHADMAALCRIGAGHTFGRVAQELQHAAPSHGSGGIVHHFRVGGAPTIVPETIPALAGHLREWLIVVIIIVVLCPWRRAIVRLVVRGQTVGGSDAGAIRGQIKTS